MAFYIKVTKQVADKLGVTAIRNKTADGNVLLWQADVTAMPGETVFERAAYVGGVCLTLIQAKEETDGTDCEDKDGVGDWKAAWDWDRIDEVRVGTEVNEGTGVCIRCSDGIDGVYNG